MKIFSKILIGIVVPVLIALLSRGGTTTRITSSHNGIHNDFSNAHVGQINQYHNR